MNKKYLVTGGAGFVGSNLCKALVETGASVTSLDNYFTGTTKNEHLGVEYIRDSTLNINKIFSDPMSMEEPRSFDTIFHLGEYSRVEQSFKDLDLVWDYNISPIYGVLNFARKTGAKLIYSGSSTKFADQTESYEESPYAFSKAFNTKLVKAYCEKHKMPYAITYFYNVYGPGEIREGPYATLIGKYMNIAEKGVDFFPITLPGFQKRNFTHVDDIISALLMIDEQGQGDEYGIGSEDAYSVHEVVDMFDGIPFYTPSVPGNRMSAKVLIEKTKALGWTPKRNLKDYISYDTYSRKLI